MKLLPRTTLATASRRLRRWIFGVRSRRVLLCVLLTLPFPLRAGQFLHPGIGLNRAQLDQLKANIENGVEPWKHNFEWLKRNDHRFSKKPRIFTRCGLFPIAKLLTKTYDFTAAGQALADWDAAPAKVCRLAVKL